MPAPRPSPPAGSCRRRRQVALVHDAATTAVMMATPADLEDFAVGFSLTEGLVETRPTRLPGVEVVETALGSRGAGHGWPGAGGGQRRRRRRLDGPTGCGLCGVESLERRRFSARAPGGRGPAAVRGGRGGQVALEAPDEQQSLRRQTRAVHAAGFGGAPRGRSGGSPRGRRPAQGARQAGRGRMARAGEPGGARRPAADQPGLGGDGTEGRRHARRADPGRRLSASTAPAVALRRRPAAGRLAGAVARADGFEVFTRPDRLRLPEAHPTRSARFVELLPSRGEGGLPRKALDGGSRSALRLAVPP